ncbi:MAG: amidase [Bryobacteraceae bacterium]
MTTLRTIAEMGAALRSKQASCVELVEGALRRIDPAWNAFITVSSDEALEEARALDAELAHGIDRGPLHGIPMAHKDLMHTRGVRTTGGSKIFSDFIPDEDAPVVAALRQAGAISIGKTNLHEFAYGITSVNPHYGTVHNPRDLSCIAGGSSGGSAAAVAGGALAFATGTDTGGSIRIPAAYCGCVGLKPTYGRVSCDGVMPLGYTFDHIGPIAATVADAATAYSIMAGVSDPAPKAGSLEGVRVGLPTNFFLDNIDIEVGLAVRRAFQTVAALGAQIVEVEVPDMDGVNTAALWILLCEAASVHRPHFDRLDEYGDDVRALIHQGRLVSGMDYVDGQRLRSVYCGQFGELFEGIDVLFTPASPIPAPPIGQMTVELNGQAENVRLLSTRFMRAFNLTGLPALSVPCGKTASGLPIGLQIAGRKQEEELVLRVGAAIEAAGN